MTLLHQVDGGIKTNTIETCARAGANVIVSGSGIFGDPNPQAVMEQMRKAVAVF